MKMDLDNFCIETRVPNHIPQTQDWDWATVRQDPLRDFDTVESSHKQFLSRLNDFQDVVYSKKCLVLQRPENKMKVWGSLANHWLAQGFQRKGPQVVGQDGENENSTSPDWIRTVQGVEAGLFQPCESDNGMVYRGSLKGYQIEISEMEMEVLNTLSMGNTSIPSIRDQQMELGLRRALLKSSEKLADQVTGKKALTLTIHTFTKKQSC